jgi:D-alanyl-D-alanine carboxypeptidase
MVHGRALGWLLASVAAVTVGACGGHKQTSPAGRAQPQAHVAPELARKLQRVLDQQRTFFRLPGAAAAVVIPGKGSWSGGSGLADRATGAPVTASTPFEIASITKAFVGALAVKLAQQGRVSLDEPLRTTLPDWPYADRITLRDLLAQTSGVSRFAGESEGTPPIFRAIDREPRAYWSPHRVLRYVGAPAFRPGERWQYNNANYLLAGLVLEHSTHEPVATALRREIVDPLGLRDVALQPQQRPSPGAAHGYGRRLGDRREHDLSDGSGFVPYRSTASAFWTAGGIVASAPSVAKFGDAVMHGTLLAPSARRQMTSFQSTGGEPGYSAYALGLGQIFSSRLSGYLWGAQGDFPGFGSTLAYLPAKRITVAVLANREESMPATLAIAEFLIETAAEGH